MSSPKRHSRGVRLRILALSAVVTFVVVGAGAASASATPIQLEWTQYKTFVGGTSCSTFLGYATKDGYMQSNGTASISGLDTTGADVTDTTPEDCATGHAWTFPATGGSINAASQAGTLEFGGTFEFFSPPMVTPPPAYPGDTGGHDFDITIGDVRVVLDGDGTGKLVASGTGLPINPMVNPNIDYSTYTDLTLFDLNLKSATCTVNWDGTTMLSNIQPSAATVDFFTNRYPVGSGPDRSPNTFGTFALINYPCAVKGATGAIGPQGPVGPAGPAGEGATLKSKSYKLKKSAYKTKRSVRGTFVTRKGSSFVGFGSVKNKRVKLTYFGKAPKGTFNFVPVSRKYKTVKIGLR